MDLRLRWLTLLATRAVLLTALLGMALAAVSAAATARQQHWGAESCGDSVWDVGVSAAPGVRDVWSALADGISAHEVTVLASAADPNLVHVAGPASACLTGVDPVTLTAARQDGVLLIHEGSMFAERARTEGVLGGVPTQVLPGQSWPGLYADAVVQPDPRFDTSPFYSGFLVGDAGAVERALGELRSRGLEVDAERAAPPWAAVAGGPVFAVMSVLTVLTAVSVTGYWALSLWGQERERIRVLRLIGLSPSSAARSRWAASVLPFMGAVVVAAAVWAAVWLTGRPVDLPPIVLVGTVAAVVGADALLAALTHMGALWMRRVPR